MLISIASIGESSKRRVTSAYSSMVEPQTLAMKRVSVKSSVGRILRTTWSTPGFCRPIALIMPSGVSVTRCGGLPRRGWPVVPFSTIAPTSRFENPAMRVYSSPKPTQPESSTIGEANFRPQKSIAREGAGEGGVHGAYDKRGQSPFPQSGKGDSPPVFHVILFEPEIPPNAGNAIRLCANTGATLHLVRPLGFTPGRRAREARGARLSRDVAGAGARDPGGVPRGARRCACLRGRNIGFAMLRRGALPGRRRVPVRARDGRACRRKPWPAGRPNAWSACRWCPGTAASTCRTRSRSWCSRPGGSSASREVDQAHYRDVPRSRTTTRSRPGNSRGRSPSRHSPAR